MKKCFRFQMVALVLVLSLVFSQVGLTGSVRAEDPSAGVTDPNLLSALINDYNADTDGDGDISQAEMGALNGELNLEWQNISNLAGLEYAFNILELRLNGNVLSNISPMFNLTQLEVIRINDAMLQNFTGFGVFTNLRILEASFNQLNDITDILQLNTLEELFLTGNNIGNSGAASTQQLTNLRRLSVADNDVSDISFLNNMTYIQGLEIQDNNISDISPLANLVNMTDFCVQNSGITDLTPLTNVNYSFLQYVDIRDNYIDLENSSQWAVIQAWIDNGTQVEVYDQRVIIPEPQPGTDPAVIPDIYLEQALFENGVDYDNDGVIRIDELEFLTGRLELWGYPLTDLTGLEHCVNLNDLALGKGNILDISDINIVTNMPYLQTIDIMGMNLGSLDGIQLPDSLERINIEQTGITSLTPLTTFISINHIWAGWNNIDSVGLQGINNLSNLGHISLQNNQIDSLSVFTDMDNIWTIEVENNLITDITPLLTMDNLFHNAIVYGNYVDFSDPIQMNVINTLMTYCENVNYEPQRFVPDPNSPLVIDMDPNLKQALIDYNADYNEDGELTHDEIRSLTGEIDITDMNISSIEGMQFAENLSRIWMGHNNVSDMSPLSNLTQLELLHIQSNPINDYSYLSNLTSLNELWLSGSDFSSIDGWSLPTSLRVLSFDFNNLSSIDAISNLTNLEYLAVTGNNLNSDAINVLSNFTNATRFDLNDNNITDISVLNNCPQLYRVELDGNSIADITTLNNLSNLGEVTLYNNYIDFTDTDQLNTLNTLISRGVYVEYEPQSTYFDPNEPAEVVEMEDNLRWALIDQGVDYNGDGELTINEMGYVDWEIDISWRDINSLSGIEYLVNVPRLFANNNNFSDISPLSSLTQIDMLGLQGCEINSLNGLENLTNLGVLWVSDNNLTDVTPIKDLNIWQLDIAGNLITSIDCLAGNTYGGEFRINGNFIDISEGSVARQLETISLSHGCEDIQIEPQRTDPNVYSDNVSMDKNLKAALIREGADYNGDGELSQNELGYITGFIDLSGQNINSISGLEYMAAITHINLSWNNFSDVSPLTNNTALIWLELGSCNIDSLSGFENLANLQILWIDNNNISNVDSLAGLTKIGQLSVANNFISNVDSLLTHDYGEFRIEGNFIDISEGTSVRNFVDDLVNRGFECISYEPQRTNPEIASEIVDFSDDNLKQALIDNGADYNGDGDLSINELGFLAGEVRLDWRNISDISGLEYLTAVTRLGLDGNHITNPSIIGNLEYLRVLDINCCGIYSLDGFQNLTNLECLFAGENNISSVVPLAGLNDRMWQLCLQDNILDSVDAIAHFNLGELRIENNNIDISEGSIAKAFVERLITEGAYNVVYEPQVSLPQPGTTPANIPDSNLEQALFDNGADYDGDGTIRIDELNYMTGWLDLWDRGISDLTGLENLININEIELGNNQLNIDDINVLQGLPYIESMNFGWMDIGSLAGLVLPDSLRRIGVSGNNLSSITELFQFSKLDHIWADQNNIENDGISGIATLVNLGHISLNNNKITSLNAFTNMDTIWTLEIPDNEITDLSPLLTMDNLEHNVIVYGNYIDLTDSTQMAIINSIQSRCWNVEYEPQRFVPDPNSQPVALEDNLRLALIDRGADYYPDGTITEDELRAMTGYLDLWGTDVYDLTGIRFLENIYGLNIGWNPVDTYGDLFYLTQLEELCINEMWIDSLTGFDVFTNLRSLEISWNNISDLSPILGLTGLENLQVGGLNLTSEQISNLGSLYNLRDIGLYENQLTDISVLGTLTNLTWMQIQGNQITDITPLANLQNLDGLHMENNNVDLDDPVQWGIIENWLNNGLFVGYEPQNPSPPDPGEPYAYIPDPELYQALIDNGANYYPEDPISIAELNYFQGNNGRLYLHGYEIVDLTGLEHCIRLERLQVTGDQLVNIDPILGLDNLWSLNLSLGALDNSKLIKVGTMTNLRFLYFQETEVSDLTPLANLINLETLYMYDNNVNDLSPLANLTNLATIVARNNLVESITSIKNMSSLSFIGLDCNRLTSIIDFVELPNIESIVVDYNFINFNDSSEVNALNSLLDRGVSVTYSSQNSVPDLNSVKVNFINQGMEQRLIDWHFDYNNDGELTVAELAVSRNDVSLGGLNITDEELSDIQYLINVDILALDNNFITDLTPLAALTNLKRLNIAFNDISDLSPLSGMSSLESLNASYNDIDELSGILSLPSLTSISLNNNNIYKADGLEELSSLNFINLRDNNLMDITALKDLGTDSSRFYLDNNYLDTSDNSNDMSIISELLDRGVGVYYENQQEFIPSPESEVVNLEENLKTMLINRGLDYDSDGILTKDELRAWTSTIWLTKLPITKLNGLEYLINASTMNIWYCPGIDFNPILGLDNLKGLSISHCELENTDLTQFIVMENLEFFFVDYNKLTSIDSLATMTNLQEISFNNNGITDISALAGMPNLRRFLGNYNKISNLSAFNGNTQLDTIHLTGNRLTSLNDLASLGSLGYLCIEGNFINLTDSNEVNYLTTLSNNGCEVVYEPQLTWPDPGSPIISIPDLGMKNALLAYNRDFNNDGELTQDEMATFCYYVDVSDNGISHIDGLQYLVHVNQIIARNNEITDISQLSDMANLTSIHFSNNHITDASVASSLYNLVWLNLGTNEIETVPDLSNLACLEMLLLSENRITDISVLENLDTIHRLNINDNNIIDITVLLTMDGLTDVRVENNYLDLTPGSDAMNVINTLIARGVNVSYEPQNPYTAPVDPETPDEVEVVEEVVETTTEGETVTAEIDDNIIESVVDDAITQQQETGEEDVDIVIPTIETTEESPDATVTLDAEAMQTASDNEIGLVVSTEEVTVDLAPSSLDAASVTTVTEESTISIQIIEADNSVVTEPVFQLNEGGTVLEDAVELNIIVTNADGSTEEITEFTEPVEVKIQLTEDDLLTITNPENLVMYWYEPVNNITEAMPTTYDAVTMTITFTTTHFSMFILVENDETAPVVTISTPVDFEVLPIGTSVNFSSYDNVTEECTVTAILFDGINALEVINGYEPGPGVYNLTVTAVDDFGNTTTEEIQFVIYDPDGGFVTGGGWINSPEGAYTADATLTGKATFGFVSKYKKGATVPTGQTQFQFKVAGLNFNSDTYDWLVVAGTKAQFKGVGTINGAGEYGFMLTAIDGDSKDKPDRFRIKIWNKATDEIVYDNQIGTDDSGDLTTDGTLLQGGSIIIHK